MHTDAITCQRMTTQQYHTTIQSHGFSQIETGGGCTAFSKVDDSGAELLITAQDDPSVPTVDDIAIVSSDGDILGEFSADELVSFLAVK